MGRLETGSNFWANWATPVLRKRLETSPEKDEAMFLFFITSPSSSPEPGNRMDKTACIQFSLADTKGLLTTQIKVRMSFAAQRVA